MVEIYFGEMLGFPVDVGGLMSFFGTFDAKFCLYLSLTRKYYSRLNHIVRRCLALPLATLG